MKGSAEEMSGQAGKAASARRIGFFVRLNHPVGIRFTQGLLTNQVTQSDCFSSSYQCRDRWREEIHILEALALIPS